MKELKNHFRLEDFQKFWNILEDFDDKIGKQLDDFTVGKYGLEEL